LQILLTVRGSMVSTAEQRFQHVLRGSITLFPWWQRGRMNLRLPSSPKGAIVGIMTQVWHYSIGVTHVLSLMATHFGNRSQFRLSEWRKNIYTQVHHDQSTYTCGLDVPKSCMRIYALSCKEKHVHVGELMFGPWYLVLGIWTYGFGP